MKPNTCVRFDIVWKSTGSEGIEKWNPVRRFASCDCTKSNLIVMRIARELFSGGFTIGNDKMTLVNVANSGQQRCFVIDVSDELNYRSLVEAWSYLYGRRTNGVSYTPSYAEGIYIDLQEKPIGRRYVIRLNRGAYPFEWHILRKKLNNS